MAACFRLIPLALILRAFLGYLEVVFEEILGCLENENWLSLWEIKVD